MCRLMRDGCARTTLAFFVIYGLDLLGKLDGGIREDQKAQCIEWIYSLQVQPSADGIQDTDLSCACVAPSALVGGNEERCGFSGGSFHRSAEVRLCRH